MTAVETQPAAASDEAGHEQVEARGWYVDGAYVSPSLCSKERGRCRPRGVPGATPWPGPAQPAPKKDGRYRTEDFDVSIAERRAVCPAGKQNTQCSRLEEETTGQVSYRFEWSTHYHDCALRAKCLGKDQRHRTLVVGAHHDLLQARRREQKTEAIAAEKNKRNAVEGTQSELVRGHGARQARHRGLPKMRLQNDFIGAACNAKRWIGRLQWEMKQAARAARGRSSCKEVVEQGRSVSCGRGKVGKSGFRRRKPTETRKFARAKAFESCLAAAGSRLGAKVISENRGFCSRIDN